MISNVLAPNDRLRTGMPVDVVFEDATAGHLHSEIQAGCMTKLYTLPLEQRVLGPILAEKARTEGDRPYMTVDGRTYSFAETDRLSRQLARGLRQSGVRKQDNVTMLLPNSAAFVLSLVRLLLAGAVFVPINPTYTGFMLDYILKDSGTRALVVDRSLAPQLLSVPQETLKALDFVAVVGGLKGLTLHPGPARYVDFAELFVEAPKTRKCPARSRTCRASCTRRARPARPRA